MITETRWAGFFKGFSWDCKGKGRRQNFQIGSRSLEKKIQATAEEKLQTALDIAKDEDPANLVDGNLKAQLDVSALKTGDYITYGYDQKGNLNRLNLLFRAGNAPTDYIELDKGTLAPPTNYPDLYNRDYLAYAPIDAVVAKAIIMTPASAERVLPTTAKTVCFKYDTATDEIEFIAKSDLAEGDLIFYDLEVNVIICVD